jgi:hypothetical protein
MDQQTKKSFWSRPEGKTGLLFLGLTIAGGGYLLLGLLPFIIGLLQSAITATLLFAALGGILYIAMDPKVHTLISYTYRGSMRKLTQAFIELDPINILKTYVEDLKQRRVEMDQQVGKLRGQMSKIQKVIADNDAQKENSLRIAEQAKKKGAQDVLVVNTRQVSRLQTSNKTMSELYTKMELLYRVLAKMYDSSGLLIQDIDNEVKVKEIERNAMLAGHSAFKSAMRIIQGDPDKKMLFDQTMDYLVDEYGAKVGEMERFIEVSSTFIEGVDLQNGVFEEEGMKMLEKWEREPSLVLKHEKEILIAKANDSNELVDLAAPISKVNSKNRYESLL